jgi:glycosyltransferase involved in cell wall biosynthesis
MKVIHLVLGKANPDRMNGVNRVAHAHAMHLHRMGMEVEIWGITKTPGAPVAERGFKTRLFRSQTVIRGLDPALMIAIRDLPQQCIFHIHGALIPDFYLVARLLTESQIPYIYTPHGAFNRVALKKNQLVKKLYIQGFERFILKNARYVHFPGQSEYDNIASLVKLDNKVLIPNGQSAEEICFKFRPMEKKDPVFGFCGRMDNYYKGLDLLIDAFAFYKKTKGKGSLWLIGDGPDLDSLRAQAAAYDLQNDIVFYGALFGEEKLNHIANVDVFVHPSHSEGFPTAVLEAAALGRPLLVTTGTNIGSIVDEYNCGIHIPDNLPETIASALSRFETLYEQRLTESMSSAAKRMVRERFDWSIIASQLAEIYH